MATSSERLLVHFVVLRDFLHVAIDAHDVDVRYISQSIRRIRVALRNVDDASYANDTCEYVL